LVRTWFLGCSQKDDFLKIKLQVIYNLGYHNYEQNSNKTRTKYHTMAKIESEEKLPKRIDNCVVYELYGQMIIRTISGFTTKALNTSPKYELSRQNASEFGRVSSMCKQVRLALIGILPKKNNLVVVNSLTKKMREVMTYDTISARGNRSLAVALNSEAGRAKLQGYHFNPEVVLKLDYKWSEHNLKLATNSISFPDGANCIGFRLHNLEFDFTNCNHQLISSDWTFYNEPSLPNALTLTLPKFDFRSGILFTLLEVQFYISEEGSYVPLEDDRSKLVQVVGL